MFMDKTGTYKGFYIVKYTVKWIYCRVGMLRAYEFESFQSTYSVYELLYKRKGLSVHNVLQLSNNKQSHEKHIDINLL